MFYVALEQYQPVDTRLINDDLAREMLPGRLRFLLGMFGFKPLRRGFESLIERNFPGTRTGICRKRYIDEKLVEAENSGIDSVVILGSGLDTRAYRIPGLSTLQVHEMDLPQTIAYKKTRIEKRYKSVPSHVKLVPIDFDRQALASVLEGHGYSLDQTSFFIWEGVTQYISETAVDMVFGFLAGAKPGSQMVFTYIAKDFIDGDNDYGLRRLFQQTRGMWRFGLRPSQIAAYVEQYSWREIEQIGADEYRRRYLDPMGITASVMEIERVVYARKP